jgi:hypothetical protein
VVALRVLLVEEEVVDASAKLVQMPKRTLMMETMDPTMAARRERQREERFQVSY